MSTIEPAQEAYEEFHKGFTLGGQGVSPTWDELLEGHKDRWRATVEVSRAPLHTEIYFLKLAAAGDEDVPGAANMVTADDIVRWRVEAAEEIERLRVRINGLESSLRGSVKAADAMRAELSARWSLIKRMRQDVEGLGIAVPHGAAQEWRNAYLAAWNGHNHLDAAGAGIRAVLRTAGVSLIEKWPPTDQDGEPVATSHGDSVRAALAPFVAHYQPWMDDWADDDPCGAYARVTFGDLRRAIAVLSAAPTPALHDDERDLTDEDRIAYWKGAYDRMAARNGELSRQIGALQKVGEQCTHPQQGGERDEAPVWGTAALLRAASVNLRWAEDGYSVVLRCKGLDETKKLHDGLKAFAETASLTSKGEPPDLSYSGAPMPPDGIEGCIYCGQPFKEGDLVLNEYEGGLGHIGCFGPERESYVGRDGEPLREDEPIPTGRPWTPTPQQALGGES